MPFNSSQNHTNAEYSQDESMNILKTSFAIPSNYADVLPYPKMTYMSESKEPYVRAGQIHL